MGARARLTPRRAAPAARPCRAAAFAAAASAARRPRGAAPGPARPRAAAEELAGGAVSPPAGQAEGEAVDCVVVGGGVYGLCTAQALAARHPDAVQRVLVTEARGRVGGNITTAEDAGRGYLWEEGPNSFQPNDSMLEAAVDAGCADELVFGDPKAPRFVFWDGRLRATPSGPDVVTFDLLSLWGKLRAGLGAVGLLNGEAPAYEETVEQFIKRNLGDEVYFRLIEPFCSGVYAGDPTKLSMKAAFGKIQVLEEKGGSLVGGALALMQEKKADPPPPRRADLPAKPPGQTVGSFRKGLKTLPEAIERNLADRIRTDWVLETIDKAGAGFALTYRTPEGPKTVAAKAVVMTTPAYVTAELLRREVPDAHQLLMSFEYPPVGAVTLAYPKSAIREDRLDDAGALPGFGQVRRSGRVAVGVPRRVRRLTQSPPARPPLLLPRSSTHGRRG